MVEMTLGKMDEKVLTLVKKNIRSLAD